jgi:hypothetical protein
MVALGEVHADNQRPAAVRPDFLLEFLEPLPVAPSEGNVGALASEGSRRGGSVATRAAQYHDGLTTERLAHLLSAVSDTSEPVSRKRRAPSTR